MVPRYHLRIHGFLCCKEGSDFMLSVVPESANDFVPPRPALRNGCGATDLNLEEC
jgi:hypothetical protein